MDRKNGQRGTCDVCGKENVYLYTQRLTSPSEKSKVFGSNIYNTHVLHTCKNCSLDLLDQATEGGE